MSRRRARLGDEGQAHKVPKSGPNVFAPSPSDNRPKVYIPVGGTILEARWPAATARKQTGQVDVVTPEVIRMSEKPRVVVSESDPYLMAEERAAKRTSAA